MLFLLLQGILPSVFARPQLTFSAGNRQKCRKDIFVWEIKGKEAELLMKLNGRRFLPVFANERSRLIEGGI
jgi:hypothetical protein